MTEITEVVEALVSPIVTDLKLELVEVEFIKEGSDWFLRVYIDTPEGDIDIGQCAQVSEQLSEELAVMEANTAQYQVQTGLRSKFELKQEK